MEPRVFTFNNPTGVEIPVLSSKNTRNIKERSIPGVETPKESTETPKNLV